MNAKMMGKAPRQNLRNQLGQTRRSAGNLSPVQFESNVRSHHRYRFTATAGVVGKVITDTSVVGSLGGVVTVLNTAVVAIFQSFRIKRLEMWSAPSAQGSNATCSVEWFGFGNSPNTEFSDTTLSTAKNAVVSCKPPANALASFWQKATGTPLFILTCPAGTIVDLILDTILSDDEGAGTVVTIASGSLGALVYLALDQVTGTHNFVPVSLVTTF